jgi:hypothetical protein
VAKCFVVRGGSDPGILSWSQRYGCVDWCDTGTKASRVDSVWTGRGSSVGSSQHKITYTVRAYVIAYRAMVDVPRKSCSTSPACSPRNAGPEVPAAVAGR